MVRVAADHPVQDDDVGRLDRGLAPMSTSRRCTRPVMPASAMSAVASAS
jgi:hypothetical protein